MSIDVRHHHPASPHTADPGSGGAVASKLPARFYPLRDVVMTIETDDGAFDLLDCNHRWRWPGKDLPPAARYRSTRRRCRECGPTVRYSD